MELLLIPVVMFVVTVVVFAVRRRLAARRRARVRHGQPVACRALLGWQDGRLRRGRLTVRPRAAGPLAGQGVVSLSGSRVLSVVAVSRGWRSRPDDVLLQLADTEGRLMRLVLHESDAALVVGLLRDGVDPRQPVEVTWRLPRRRWPTGCLVLALLWLASWSWLVLGGERVQATVVRVVDDGVCEVTWTGADGRTNSAEVDCGGESPGERRTVWALGPPASGAAVDVAWTAAMVPAVAAILLGAAAVGRWRGRRFEPPAAGRRAGEVLGELPSLSEDDVRPSDEPPAAVLARLAPYAVRQIPADGWQHPRRPAGAPPPSTTRDVMRSLIGPAVAIAIVGLLTASWGYRWYVLQTQATATATGTSTGETISSGPGPVPDDVLVRYRDAEGVEHQAEVTAVRELPAGAKVAVRYAVDDPGWARLQGPDDGLDRGLALMLIGAALTLGFAVVRGLSASGRVRAVRSALSASPRPGLGTLTADPTGDPLLLLCDPVSTPVRLIAVPLRTPLPHGAAEAFSTDSGISLSVRGRLTDGAPVVVEVSAVPGILQPSAPAWHPTPADLVNALDTATAFTETQLTEAQPDSNQRS